MTKLNTAGAFGPTPRSQRLIAIESWLARRRKFILAAIVSVSIFLRIVYFLQLNRGPCIWQHRWEGSDMHFFDAWAKQIAGIDPATGQPIPSDWLSQRVQHPLHSWHVEIAAAYYKVPAAKLADWKKAANNPATPEHRDVRGLWDRWCGDNQFYQDPLYAYVVAATYKILVPDPRWVFALQMVVGVLANVLLYLIARRYFGEIVGIVTAGLATFCSPMLYYELILVRETLISFAGLGLVYLTGLAVERNTWRWWLATGAAVGVAMVLKSHFMLFLAGVAAAILLIYWMRWPEMVKAGAAYGLGFLIAVTPLAARNLALGVAPLTTTSAGGITFIGANTSDYNGDGFFVSPKYAPAIMTRTNGKMLPSIIESLKTHTSVASYLNLLWKKNVLAWHWYEIPSNSCFDYFRLHAGILRQLPVTFFLIGPLALVGLILAVRTFSRTWPLYLLTGASLAVVLMFHVMSRHRRPLEAACIPFAAVTIVWIVRWAMHGRAGLMRAIPVAAAVVAVWCWTGQPLPEGESRIRPVDYIVANQYYYLPLAGEAALRDDWKGAADVFAAALAYEPECVAQINRHSPPADESQWKTANSFGRLRSAYAEALRNAGMVDQAIRQRERAEELVEIAEEAGATAVR